MFTSHSGSGQSNGDKFDRPIARRPQRVAELERAVRELESYVLTVTHQLHSPLRAVGSVAQMLEEDYGDKFDDKGRQLLAMMRENCSRMGALIDDLLEYSRLGGKPVEAIDVDMNALVAEVWRELSAHPAIVLPRFEVGALPVAHGDRVLLKQVWANLLSNAVKFSARGDQPRVDVWGSSAGGENIYSVKDNGVGFEMRYYDKLFGLFQRLHGNDEFPGTGMGLAIVQRLVSRHGGRVWARSGAGKGATFHFVIPGEQRSE